MNLQKIYLYGIKTLSTQFYMRRKFRLEYKKMRPQGEHFLWCR